MAPSSTDVSTSGWRDSTTTTTASTGSQQHTSQPATQHISLSMQLHLPAKQWQCSSVCTLRMHACMAAVGRAKQRDNFMHHTLAHSLNPTHHTPQHATHKQVKQHDVLV